MDPAIAGLIALCVALVGVIVELIRRLNKIPANGNTTAVTKMIIEMHDWANPKTRGNLMELLEVVSKTMRINQVEIRAALAEADSVAKDKAFDIASIRKEIDELRALIERARNPKDNKVS